MWCCICIVYETTMEKNKPMLWVSSAGSLTPTAVSSYIRTKKKKKHHKKPPTHSPLQKVFRHHLSHHDRSAGRQWCWLSSRFFSNISSTVLLWPRKTLGTSGYSWLLLCQKVPQYSFSLSLCLSAQCFCFVSQKCSISLAMWPLVFCCVF